MARHLHFRNDGDVSRLRIGDDVANLCLRIVAAVTVVMYFTRIVSGLASRAAGTDRRKSRIFFRFHPPTLVVGEMPMKNIQLVMRGDIDVPLHRCHVVEMAADVEMNAPPTESWPVGY